MWYFVVALVVVVTLIWQMTDLKARVVDLIARNLREPKGLVGHLVRVSFDLLKVGDITDICTRELTKQLR